MENTVYNLENLNKGKRMAELRKILSNNGIRVSHQRLLILEYLASRNTHPSADQIYNDLKTLDPIISQATVYNSLNLFTQNNLIKELDFNLPSKRYEFIKSNHSHFICESCGKIIDLEQTESKDEACVEGFEVKSVDITYRGICPDCK